MAMRRVATVERGLVSRLCTSSRVAPRLFSLSGLVRGLKPTATVIPSLRDNTDRNAPRSPNFAVPFADHDGYVFRMANTFTSLHYHVIFSTKNREPGIGREIEERVWAYLGGIAREGGLKALLIGGIENHVHLLLGLPASTSLSKAVQLIKGGSSGWIKETFPGSHNFAWQDGFAGFTVSKSQIPEVEAYIRNQREHHRVKSFEEEYRAFLIKHEVKYDEQYLFG
jgi:REP element-mobilizing transposase RayT